MKTPKENGSNSIVATQAAEWFLALQSVEASAERQSAFADWLRRSPVHVEEFLQLAALQGDLARLQELRDLDVHALLQSVKLDELDLNVIAFAADPPAKGRDELAPSTRSGRGGAKRFGIRVALASAAVILLLFGLVDRAQIHAFLDTDHYATAVGEQRSLTLSDGSQVQLNVRSKLSARVDQSARDIHLDHGEALFRVAKNSSNPFRVHTPQAIIEAKGTQFNVQVRDGKTDVALIEGHVEVTLPSAGDGHAVTVLLNPGEEVTVGARTTPATPRAADIRAVTAWTEHRLVFEDVPLSQVIAEFNRYNRQFFTIEDPALRDVRITASFDAESAQTFANSLSAAGNVRVTQQPNGTWRIDRP